MNNTMKIVPLVTLLFLFGGAGTAAGQQQLRVRTGASYLSHSSTRLIFGLGAADAAAVRVRWPDGSTQDLGSLPAGAYTVEAGRPAQPVP